jgi:hypothetical protein
MGFEDRQYHQDRERHCRSMAAVASDPDVRRRHEELAKLHASRAQQVGDIGGADTATAI